MKSIISFKGECGSTCVYSLSSFLLGLDPLLPFFAEVSKFTIIFFEVSNPTITFSEVSHFMITFSEVSYFTITFSEVLIVQDYTTSTLRLLYNSCLWELYCRSVTRTASYAIQHHSSKITKNCLHIVIDKLTTF